MLTWLNTLLSRSDTIVLQTIILYWKEISCEILLVIIHRIIYLTRKQMNNSTKAQTWTNLEQIIDMQTQYSSAPTLSTRSPLPVTHREHFETVTLRSPMSLAVMLACVSNLHFQTVWCGAQLLPHACLSDLKISCSGQSRRKGQLINCDMPVPPQGPSYWGNISPYSRCSPSHHPNELWRCVCVCVSVYVCVCVSVSVLGGGGQGGRAVLPL